MIFLTQYFAYIFIVQGGRLEPTTLIPPLHFFLLSFSTILIAAAGYIINDYYDIKIDLVNKPGRIVIGRIITRRQALFIHAAFNAIALAIGLYVSWKIALFFGGCGLLLWFYSNYLKRTILWGNISISLLSAATIWVITFYYHQSSHLVYLYFTFGFFISLIREIIKDMEDVKGDATYGCRTLPIVWGFRKTKILVLCILVLFCLILLVESSSVSPGIRSISYYLLLFPTFYLGFKIVMADKQKDYFLLSQFCKWFMVLGILSLGIA
jgi:4-hydroxybenzoate polyprenyltransferase